MRVYSFKCANLCQKLETTDTHTYFSTDGLVNTSGIKYFTTEQSSWHYHIIEAVQVDCSIISSVSVECCSHSGPYS